MQARYRLDLADRFAVSSATARRFAANPSDPTSRWAPCPAHSFRWITCFLDTPAPGEALPPPIGYGPRLGSVRLDFHQQATRPARRALRPPPTAARPPTPLPGFAGYRPGIASRHPAGDGAETALPSSQDDHPHVQRPIRRRVPQRPLLDPRRLPWPSPSPDRLGSLCTRPKTGPLDDACSGFTHVADRTVAPPRFIPGLSTTHGGLATGDPGVSPDRTRTGRPP
jgi:hypothetical protein